MRFAPWSPLTFASFVLCLFAPHAAGAEKAATGPTTVPDFALLDQHGRYHQLTAQADVPVVVLYIAQTGCPIVRQDLPTLAALATSTADRARILLLDPATADDRAGLIAELGKSAPALPVLLDPSQMVARGLGATRTGEALVIRTQDWSIAWRGPVDDSLGYGTQKPATRSFLAEAIAAVAAGSPPPADGPAAKGCLITYEQHPPADYATVIAPLLATHCASCHATGGVAPFALNGYAQAKKHGAMIDEVLRTRRMPPWGADAPGGSFVGDNVMTPAESAVLSAWIAAGAPRGDGPDPLAALPPATKDEWPLGKPDLIVECPPQDIPARGVLPYRRFTVPVTIPRDTWVRAYDLHPSERTVMHHGFAFAVPPGTTMKARDPRFSGLDDFLANYVPGLGPISFPADSGMAVAKDTGLAFQLHYTTSGTAVTDHPRLGLYFSDRKPAHEIRVASVKNTKFIIPPGVRDVPASGTLTTPTAVTLIGMSPHLHLRGSRMSFQARLPDGTTRELLSVPHYDLNWQMMYRPATPLALPAGTIITCVGAWDNSRFNPANPDPTKTVHWGEQSWDEMFLGYLLYSIP